MRAMLKIGFGLLLLAFVLIGLSYSMLRAQVASGGGAPGSRLLDTEPRPLARAVGTVELTGPFNLTLRQGPSPKLEVRGEQRVLANVDTSIDGDTLHIAPRGILLRRRQPIEVLVTLPALQALHVNGSGDYSISGFAGERLQLTMDGSGNMRFNGRYRSIQAAVHGTGDLELTGGTSEAVTAEVIGAGNLTLVGATRSLHATVRGSGDLDARHLRADAATLIHEGSGDSSLYARQHVNADLSGSGDVTVYGNPGHREISRSGSGNISFPD